MSDGKPKSMFAEYFAGKKNPSSPRIENEKKKTFLRKIDRTIGPGVKTVPDPGTHCSPEHNGRGVLEKITIENFNDVTIFPIKPSAYKF